MVPGDWPAQAFMLNVLRMGWTASPGHLGAFLCACTRACAESGVRGAQELRDGWEKRCGLLGREAVLALGSQARFLVTTIGPLHVMLNLTSDIQKHHGDTFINRFYKLYTGEDMHSNPRVRETLMVCEMLLASWVEVRVAAMALLQKVMQQQQAARFDITCFLFFFEHRLPLAVMSHSIFLREGGGVTAPPGMVPDDNGWLWCTCHVAASAFMTQRKNCTTAMLEHVDRMLHWRRSKHGLHEHMRDGEESSTPLPAPPYPDCLPVPATTCPCLSPPV